jgi:hypothetical protein
VAPASTITGTCTSECVIAGLTWSGPKSVVPSGCALVTSAMQTNKRGPAQYANLSNGAGYYYNWTCLNAQASTICPSPWRVPTRADLAAVRSAVTPAALILLWGLPGRMGDNGGILNGAGTMGAVWTSAAAGSNYAYSSEWSTSAHSEPTRWYSDGEIVRCVR